MKNKFQSIIVFYQNLVKVETLAETYSTCKGRALRWRLVNNITALKTWTLHRWRPNNTLSQVYSYKKISEKCPKRALF